MRTFVLRLPFVAAAVAMAALIGLALGVPAAAAATTPGSTIAPSAAPLARPSSVASAASGAPITQPGPGYWLLGADGGVFPYGRGAYEGGLAAQTTNAAIVGGAVTTSGVGYWLVASDGGVFAFGDARWAGSLPSAGAHDRIIGMAAQPSGSGYLLAGRDGSVFAFGAARYLGGLGGRALSAPIVAVAATPDGRGYWMAGADGAVYAFGDAPYLGGLTGVAINSPVTAMAVTSSGRGYWLAGADGGVYAFGDAAYDGGLSGRQHAPIVGIARSPSGPGYWLVGSDGGVFGEGGVGYFGSVGASRLNRGVVAIVSGSGIAIPKVPAAPASSSGFDVSWPQCDRLKPAPPYGFALVGVTAGHLFSANPCLATQWAWATSYGSFASLYINTDAPTAAEFAAAMFEGAMTCGPNVGCMLDRWGREGADQALQAAGSLPSPMWWLDVETANIWLPDPAANAVILRGMIDELQRAGKRVGIYSTAYQWGVIAGGYAPGLPVWIPGAPSADPGSYCSDHAFAGGRAYMVQSGDGLFDTDVLCGAGLASYRTGFAPPAPLVVPQYGTTTTLGPAGGQEAPTFASSTPPSTTLPVQAGIPVAAPDLSAPAPAPAPAAPPADQRWPDAAGIMALVAAIGGTGLAARQSRSVARDRRDL